MDVTLVFKRVLKASRTLGILDPETINRVLLEVSDAAVKHSRLILSENEKDLARMDTADPKYDRLQLTEKRLGAIAGGIRDVARLPNPLGRILSETRRPNGLKISKISVPFGVIGVIYEARPNVTFDVFSLCLKSGNACILKGGSDALHTNTAIVSIIKRVLGRNGISEDILALLPAGRTETLQLLKARQYVDLIIPRGGR